MDSGDYFVTTGNPSCPSNSTGGSDVKGGVNQYFPEQTGYPQNMLPYIPNCSRYHIYKEIGQGAFGTVWAATDLKTHRRVAIKRIPEVFNSLGLCKRVFREVRMLDSFRHDNILGLVDILQPPAFEFFREIYVLTELMESDLFKTITRPQPITVDHIKLFMYQILRGLKYLHSANILHRDLKPGNLLVNSNCVLKICDFGLSRLWDPRDSMNMTFEVVTLLYRAPELLMGARRYTSAVDMWSVGCIFAELFARKVLFSAESPIEQLNLIISLLGTPTADEMRDACEESVIHVMKVAPKKPQLHTLESLSPEITQEAVHLLAGLIQFDSRKRLTVDQALNHPFLAEGRLRFHTFMCSCCYVGQNCERVFCPNLDPAHPAPFNPRWENDLSKFSMFELRDQMYEYLVQRNGMNNTSTNYS